MLKRAFWGALIAVVAGVTSASADECRSTAASGQRTCVRACTDTACRTACRAELQTSLAACRGGTGARAKGNGTAARPIDVGIAHAESSYTLNGDRGSLAFRIKADKTTQVRMYLSDYTSPIDVAFGPADGSAQQVTHFIKAPDYPAQALFDVTEGQTYVYTLTPVSAPTSVKLRTYDEDDCATSNQFYRVPHGSTCRD